MTEDEQLELGGLGDQPPVVKKVPARRRTAKPKAKAADVALTEPSVATADVALTEPSVATADVAKLGIGTLGGPRTEASEVESQVEVDGPVPMEMDRESQPSPTRTPVDEPQPPPEAASPDTVESAVSAESAPVRLFFLTNRMNLNGLLSSRLLAPTEAFYKYYDDLLELAPGWVPILTAAPPTKLIDRVMAERGAGAPVLVELDESVLSGSRPDSLIVFVRGAAISAAKAIHFRDAKSLREHRARGYSNVFPHEGLLQVSPELFAGDAPSDEVILPAWRDSEVDWKLVDRFRGAVSAAVAASDSGEALAVAAGLLGAPNLPDTIVMPPWLRWSDLADQAGESSGEEAAGRADRLIFQASYRVLGTCDQAEAWRPSEVLEAVAADVAAGHPEEDVQAIVDRHLQRVRELVNVERDFEPFRNPGSPYVAAKAILMVLLRPDLGQLLEWPPDESGADDATRVVAAVLAGRLRGLSRESVKLRSMRLDDRTAAWAVREACGIGPTSLGEVEFVANESKTVILVDGVELAEAPPLIPDPALAYEAMAADVRAAARVAVSRKLGWAVTVVVRLPAGAAVDVGEAHISVTTPEVVRVETMVDEREFGARLRSLSLRERKTANEVLRSTNHPEWESKAVIDVKSSRT